MSEKYRTPLSSERKPLQDLLPLDQPLAIQIDTCSICNFRCKFCFQNFGKSENDHQIMDINTFTEIISEVKEFDLPIKKIYLSGFGEPMLNPHIVDFVKILKQNKIAECVEIITNGSLLTHEISDGLIEAGLDLIIFSINGLNDLQYEKIVGRRVVFSNIIENISYMYERKENLHMHAKIIGEYYNQQEQDLFIKIFEPIVDTLFIDHLMSNGHSTESLGVDDVEFKHMYGLEILRNKICPEPFYKMVIHSNGKISPCCSDYHNDLKMGDDRSNIKDIWNGREFSELRLAFLTGDGLPGICQNCEYRYQGTTADITPYKDELLMKFSKKFSDI